MNSAILQIGGDEMSSKQTIRLIEWLKKEGYTLDEIMTALKYIANVAE